MEKRLFFYSVIWTKLLGFVLWPKMNKYFVVGGEWLEKPEMDHKHSSPRSVWCSYSGVLDPRGTWCTKNCASGQFFFPSKIELTKRQFFFSNGLETYILEPLGKRTHCCRINRNGYTLQKKKDPTKVSKVLFRGQFIWKCCCRSL